MQLEGLHCSGFYHEFDMKKGDKPILSGEAGHEGLVEELRLRKLELEAQNQELIAARQKAEDIARLYTDLYVEIYNFSPAGYYRLDGDGRIEELNLNGARLLDKDRSALLGNFFSQFVAESSKSEFNRFFQKVFEKRSTESCEVKISVNGGTTRHLHLEGIVSEVEQKCLITAIDITAHQKMEASLRTSEEKYRKLHESLRDGYVYVTMDGRILESNTMFQNLVGFSQDELQHLTYFDLTPENWHAYENEIVNNEIIPKGFSRVYEKEYRKSDGSLLPVELRTFLIRDDQDQPVGMWAIVRDITQRKHSNDVLRESEKRYRNLIELTPTGIAIYQDLKYCYLNPAALAILGASSQEEMIGKPALSIVHPDSREEVVKRMELVLC